MALLNSQDLLIFSCLVVWSHFARSYSASRVAVVEPTLPDFFFFFFYCSVRDLTRASGILGKWSTTCTVLSPLYKLVVLNLY
jgi:hypothetical protein